MLLRLVLVYLLCLFCMRFYFNPVAFRIILAGFAVLLYILMCCSGTLLRHLTRCTQNLILLQVVRCQEQGCSAALHQASGHEVCRSHSGCAVHVGDLIVWHPDGCDVCYALYEQAIDDSADRKSRDASLQALKVWVSGFGRNVGAGNPYILSKDICNVLFPGAWITASVTDDVAAPLIAGIRELTQPSPDDSALSGGVSEDAADLDLGLESPNIVPEHQAGKGVSEAGSSLFSSPSSTVSSFKGFSKSSHLTGVSGSIVPKVKSVRKKTLPTPAGRSEVPPAAARAASPVPSTSTASPSGLQAESQSRQVVPPPPAFDTDSFFELLLERIDARVDSKLSGLANSFQSLSEKVESQQEFIQGLADSGSRSRSHSVPDPSTLPPFDLGNPWRLALYAPVHGYSHHRGFGHKEGGRVQHSINFMVSDTITMSPNEALFGYPVQGKFDLLPIPSVDDAVKLLISTAKERSC
ncbi:uncharacterized protein [Macrobrachium rosenbergii]|uniref:uncharacterized protein n=1 Tax=Macrobrachium rosenbergii TaxID=79674 RepID=UPI0034D63024